MESFSDRDAAGAPGSERLVDVNHPEPLDVPVDFSRVGHATRFSIAVVDLVRSQLHVGDEVTVSGPSVHPTPARVTRIHPTGSVEFLLAFEAA